MMRAARDALFIEQFLAISILLSRQYPALGEAPKVHDAFFRHPIVGRTNNGLLGQ
jgi:hypothetical protein